MLPLFIPRGAEKELAKLIMSQQIAARIDSQNKVLHARRTDQRTTTFSAAIQMGDEYMRDTKAMLLRINLMRADFVVKGSSEAHGPSKSSRQEQRHASGPSAGPSASSVPPAPPGGGAFGD